MHNKFKRESTADVSVTHFSLFFAHCTRQKDYCGCTIKNSDALGRKMLGNVCGLRYPDTLPSTIDIHYRPLK